MCPAGCATWQGVSKSKKKTQFMLLILTFGAIINSPRFYPRAWGEEPFISPISVGNTGIYYSSCSPRHCLHFGHAWGNVSARILSSGCPSPPELPVVWYTVCESFVLCRGVSFPALSWLASCCLSGGPKASLSLCFSIVMCSSLQLMWKDCVCGWQETASWWACLGLAEGSRLGTIFRC